MNENILIVDDDDLLLEAVKTFLSQEPFQVSFASNGQEALQLLDKYEYDLLVTDLYMPIIDGFELIHKLKDKQNPPTIIVLSNNTNVQEVVQLMKEGVFDYLTKPIQKIQLISSIEKGIEHHNVTQVQKNLELEHQSSIFRNESWESYRKKIQRQSFFKNKFQILDNIRTSFNQGIGFGSLSSVIQRIEKKAKKKDGYYEVPETLMKLLFENEKASRRILEFFEDIEELNTSDSSELLHLNELHSLILNLVRNLNSKYASIKNQKIILSESKIYTNLGIRTNKKYFEKMVTEILMNAFKFSLPNSKIFILLNSYENHLIISFLNSPEEDQRGIIGIPEEYSELVFEPFFRMSKFVYEAYPTLDLGLGLTFVEKVVQKYGGKIQIKNIKSYIPHTSKVLTLVELEFDLI